MCEPRTSLIEIYPRVHFEKNLFFRYMEGGGSFLPFEPVVRVHIRSIDQYLPKKLSFECGTAHWATFLNSRIALLFKFSFLGHLHIAELLI